MNDERDICLFGSGLAGWLEDRMSLSLSLNLVLVPRHFISARWGRVAPA